MAIIYNDTFDATTTGQIPTGWVNGTGANWITTTTNPASGRTKTLTNSPYDDGDIVINQATSALTDFEIITQDQGNDFINSNLGKFYHLNSAGTNGYLINYTTFGGVGNVAIYRMDSSAFTQLGTTQVVSYLAAANDNVNTKIKVTAGVATIKIWKVGTTEPSTYYTLNTADTTYPSGYTGYRSGTISTGVYYLQSVQITVDGATTYTLTGPSGGVQLVQSGNFTVTPNGIPSVSLVVTPNDGGAGGSFAPTSLTFTTAAAQTFKYTPPAGAATRTISCTHTGGGFTGNDPASLPYVVTGASVPSTTYSATGPSTGPVGNASSNFTVTPNNDGPSVSLVVTPSAASGTFSPTSLTFGIGSTTPQTFTYTPASTGAKVISFTHTGGGFTGNDPASLTYTALATGAIPLDDPNVWYCDSFYPTGSPGSVTAMTAQASQSYFKFGFTGTSVDLTFGAVGASGYAVVQLSVDGLVNTSRISLGTGTTHATITGLASGNHQAMLMTLTTFQGDAQRWTNPVVKVPLTAINLDSGSFTIAANLYPKRVLLYGDSISEGFNAQDTSGNSDYSRSYSALLCNAMDAEYTIRAFGGTALAVNTANPNQVGYVPPCYVVGNDSNSTWNKRDSAHSMLDGGGKYFVQPDYVFINLGQNDSSEIAYNASYNALLPAIRAAAPDALIFCVVPFSGVYRSNVGAAVTAARSGGDTRVYLLDVGTHQSIGVTGVGGNFYSNVGDGIHPNTYKMGLLGAVLARLAGNITGGTGSGGGPLPQIGSSLIKSR